MAYSTRTIAEGCFGKVYKQKYNDTWAAIKKVPQDLISKYDLDRETEVYKKASHPNIVKLLGKIDLKDGKWIIPLEFIFGEDLETTIFKEAQSKIKLTPSIKGTIITGMCEGLHHLHSKDIVHQDLKPDNIMVEHDTNRAVIIDLGLAKFFRYGQNSAKDEGNNAYSAPEVLQRGSQRDQRSDVWAMGKIIAELCARDRLYTPSVCPAKINDILKDQPYCHVVCRMVHPDPTLRASMGGVMSEIKRVGGPGNNPVKKDYLKPATPHISVGKLSPAPGHRGASPMTMEKSPLKLERSPKPEFKAPPPRAAMPLPPSPYRTEDKNKNQGLVPTGRTERTEDLMKGKFFQGADQNLPRHLPTTGRVVTQSYEIKNREVQTWKQEVVTEGGQMVKFVDVKYNSKIE
ncbi:serine/threonine-protein kinase Nek6-like [Trematomus bernacchii]|uniref:serine/threonine-protein kinase Nek6-like n=1 Tax=Trematomus bernacchii TaxID=40690 RepID=UPI00146F91AF|nr:serine/threonine-protein kinase Nek6-like [Trematomus bernacchii]